MKIAFTGTSGSGKTTLCKWVEKEFGVKHISSSAQDLFTDSDKKTLLDVYGYTGQGHANVIRLSANDYSFGHAFQTILQKRRAQAIRDNFNFVTDRSPIDNLTYMINQVGMHPEFTDSMVTHFAGACLSAWISLTHVIYIKAIPDNVVENNGSRVANGFYQMGIDAQFGYWYNYIFKGMEGPKVLVIDYWDLEQRKKNLYQFLKNV